MKKVLILFAGLALLVSCTKNIEAGDEGKTDPGKKPVQSTSELTLKTYANLTRAIAEGSEMPENNVIGLYPNFMQDGKSIDPFDTTVTTFGYDETIKSWRGMAPVKTKGLLDLIIADCFTWSPLYWPGGDRITMDYTSFASSNLSGTLAQAVRIFICKKMIEMGKNEYEIQEMLDDVNPYIAVAENFLKAKPMPYNSNRLDVDYEFAVLNLMGMILLENLDSPVLDRIMVGVVLGLCVLADVPTGLDIDDDPLTLADVDNLINAIMSGSGPIGQVLQPYLERYPKTVEFVVYYVEAEKLLTQNPYIEDKIEDKPVLGKQAYTPVRTAKLTAAQQKAVNHAYWLFLNQLPKVSKYVQDDLMYSYGRSLRNSNGGAIQAVFNHAKAWVKVVVNNQTHNDIFVSGIGFEDVNTGGTLVIDNSKSKFEAYWDFSNRKPYGPVGPEESEYGLGFEAYSPTTLNGTKSMVAKSEKKGKSEEEIKIPAEVKAMLSVGLIPDLYLVPSGCYGPALSIEEFKAEEESGEPEISVDPLVPSGPVTAYSPGVEIPYPVFYGLRSTYLNSDQPFDPKVAANLGGAMFPAQEPGMINLQYFSWNKLESESNGKHTVQEIEMGRAVEALDRTSLQPNTVTLNLPRLTWEMGKAYIYVITIYDNEIIINPNVTVLSWEDATKIFAPEETGIRSKDPIEGFEEGESTENWFGN